MDVVLFDNDHVVAARRVRAVLDLVAPYRRTVHECSGGDPPSEENRIDEQTLFTVLSSFPDPPPPPPVRPDPDPVLSRTIADATRAALTDLRHRHPEQFYAFALLTTGEGLAPYLAACSVEGDARAGLDRWYLPDSPYAVWGYEEHFGEVVAAFEARGSLSEADDEAAAEAEHTTRFVSVEEALRLLDIEGLFGTGPQREQVLLIAGILPPGACDTGAVRRLNPPGSLRQEWLREVSEQPPLPVDPVTTAELAGHRGPVARAPNPTIVDLWQITPGLYLHDDHGTAIHGPHQLAERNETYEVAEYAPGWVQVGQDGAGKALFMREIGTGFDPANARAGAEVFRLSPGELCPDLATEGEYVTDDLIGWAAERTR